MRLPQRERDFMSDARCYLAQLSAMAGEAARSDNPAVVRLALSVLDLQPEKAREFLLESDIATQQDVDRFIVWLDSQGN